MLWPLLLGAIGVAGGVTAVAHLRNRHLFSAMRNAEEEVRNRFLKRPRAEPNQILRQFSGHQQDRGIAEHFLVGIAGALKVPTETLGPDDRFADLCRVELSEATGTTPVHKCNYLIVFSDALMEILEQNLTEDEWEWFLSDTGTHGSCEEAIFDSVYSRRLVDVISLVIKAKSQFRATGS